MTAVTDDIESIIGGLHDKAKDLVRLAWRVRWTVRPIAVGKGVNLIPPGPGGTVSVHPVSQWNENKLRSLGKKILTYGDPDLVDAHLKANEPKPAAPKPKPGQLVYTKIETPAAPIEPLARTIELQTITPSSTLRPWLAKAAEGVLYPSVGVLERVKDGQVVEYVCTLSDCTYSADNPRSVLSHFNRTADHNIQLPRKIAYQRRAVLADSGERPPPTTDPLKILDALRVAIVATRSSTEDNEKLRAAVAELGQERDELTALLEVAEQEIAELRDKWDAAAALFGGKP